MCIGLFNASTKNLWNEWRKRAGRRRSSWKEKKMYRFPDVIFAGRELRSKCVHMNVISSMFGGTALKRKTEKHTKSCKIQISHMFPSSDSVCSFLMQADCVFASLLIRFLHIHLKSATSFLFFSLRYPKWNLFSICLYIPFTVRSTMTWTATILKENIKSTWIEFAMLCWMVGSIVWM